MKSASKITLRLVVVMLHACCRKAQREGRDWKERICRTRGDVLYFRFIEPLPGVSANMRRTNAFGLGHAPAAVLRSKVDRRPLPGLVSRSGASERLSGLAPALACVAPWAASAE